MARFIERVLLVLKFISALGGRGIPISWKLYVGAPGKVVKVSLGGRQLFARRRTSDVAVFRQAFVERDSDFTIFPQAESVMSRYREILAGGRKPLVLDCGAHTGFSTVFLASIFPEALLVAIEPAADNFELLRRNLAACPAALTLRAGIWDKTTHLRITNPPADSNSYQTVECGPAEPGSIAAVSIPDLLERYRDAEPLLIKIDVEGSEQVLFRNNVSWMEKFPLLIIELHDWLLPRRRTSAPFLSLLPQLNCDIATRGEHIFLFNWNALRDAVVERRGARAS